MWKRDERKIGKDKTFIVGGLSRYRLWYFFARLGNKFKQIKVLRLLVKQSIEEDIYNNNIEIDT